MRPFLSLFALLFTLGCGPQLAPRAPGDPVLEHPAPPIPPDPGHLERAARIHFQNGDLVRALRLAFLATDLAPKDPGPVFLTALIYDLGFGRPDLAVNEYAHLLETAPFPVLRSPLRQRVTYLHRAAARKAVARSFDVDDAAPLAGSPLAVYPFKSWTADPSELGVGLADLLLFDLEKSLGQEALSPLWQHMAGQAFQEAFPEPSFQAFARWSGARQILVGEIAPQEARDLVIRASLLDSRGEPLATLKPIRGSLCDVPSLRRALTEEVLRALGLVPYPDTGPPPLRSALALALHGRALRAYFSGETGMALRLFADAARLEPESPLIARWHRWVENDLQGEQMAQPLTLLYRKVSVQPDPLSAAHRRLLATQALMGPDPGLDGREPALPPTTPKTEAHP